MLGLGFIRQEIHRTASVNKEIEPFPQGHNMASNILGRWSLAPKRTPRDGGVPNNWRLAPMSIGGVPYILGTRTTKLGPMWPKPKRRSLAERRWLSYANILSHMYHYYRPGRHSNLPPKYLERIAEEDEEERTAEEEEEETEIVPQPPIHMYTYYRPGRRSTLPPNPLETVAEEDEDGTEYVPQPPPPPPGIPERMAGEEEEAMEVDPHPPPRMLSPVFPVIAKGKIPPQYRRK